MPLPNAAGLAGRSREWDLLRDLTAKAAARGLSALSEEELWELPSLYRRTLSDLSLLRARGGSPQLAQELAHLCNRAHGIVYRGTAQRRGAGVASYIFDELPRSVRRQGWYILASAAVMLLFALLGWLHCSYDRTAAETVLSPRMIGSIETSLAGAREQSDLGLAAQIPREQRGAMAAAITANNIGVALRAFAYGIAGGVLTIVILAFNGYMLGAVGNIYFTTGAGIDIDLPLYFIAGIAPHGAIELSAICLAAAAGMLIGFSWVFPGRRRRGDALRAAAGEAMKVLLACCITLLFAGIIEGFVTPLEQPAAVSLELWFWLKIALGLTVWLVWLVWLARGGRASQRKLTSSVVT
jgi:uncharacterized membrane protein SpoIIM required for sporulation